MPRKDRRFTAADIYRIHCKNLTAQEQRFLSLMGLSCADGNAGRTDREMLAAALEFTAWLAGQAGIPILGGALSALAAAVREVDEQRIIDQLGLMGEPTA